MDSESQAKFEEKLQKGEENGYAFE